MWKNKKIIIFDLDGTLIDSMGIWNKVDSRLIAKLNFCPPDEMEIQNNRDNFLRKHLGEPDIYLLYCDYLRATTHSKLSPNDIYVARNKIAQKMFEDELMFKEGAKELIVFLNSRGYKLILATTSGIQQIKLYRTRCKKIDFNYIDLYFSAIYTKEDIGRLKPDPAIHQFILKEYDAVPSDCLVIEDSLSGIQAAKAAQIEVVAVMDYYSRNNIAEIKADADYFFENLFELLDFWKEGGPQ